MHSHLFKSNNTAIYSLCTAIGNFHTTQYCNCANRLSVCITSASHFHTALTITSILKLVRHQIHMILSVNIASTPALYHMCKLSVSVIIESKEDDIP